MADGTSEQSIVCGQEDLRTTSLGTGEMQRVEVGEPERFQLLRARHVLVLDGNPAGNGRQYCADAAEPLRVGDLPDFVI